MNQQLNIYQDYNQIKIVMSINRIIISDFKLNKVFLNQKNVYQI